MKQLPMKQLLWVAAVAVLMAIATSVRAQAPANTTPPPAGTNPPSASSTPSPGGDMGGAAPSSQGHTHHHAARHRHHHVHHAAAQPQDVGGTPVIRMPAGGKAVSK
jgi:hypothetical protein